LDPCTPSAASGAASSSRDGAAAVGNSSVDPSSCLPQGTVTPACRSTRSGKRPLEASSVEVQQTQHNGQHRLSRSGDREARHPDCMSDAASQLPDRDVGRQSTSSAAPSVAEAASTPTFDMASLLERAGDMLFGEGERPVATHIDPIAREATYGLVHAVRDVVGDLWKARENDIKAACAPQLIDEVDVLALLIADALGKPLLHPDDRNAVGKRVESCASRLRREKIPEAREKARKAAVRQKADAEQRATAMAEAVATLLAQPYEGLKLPAATVGRQERRERESPSAKQQLKAAQAAFVCAEAAKDAAAASYRRALNASKAVPDCASESVLDRYEQRVNHAGEKWDAAIHESLAALATLHAAEKAVEDEVDAAEEAEEAARAAAEEAADREDKRQWLLLHEATIAAMDDAIAAHAAVAIDSGELTWDGLEERLDEWEARGEPQVQRGRFRARVKELFEIIMEHPQATKAPALVAAAAGPSTELQAAENALRERLLR
jgi:hypothetical protein